MERNEQEAKALLRQEFPRVLTGEPLKKHCSFRIGGPAELYCEAESVEGFREIYLRARELGLPIQVLGKGSNVLISDRGLPGLVCVFSSAFSAVRVLEESEKDAFGLLPLPLRSEYASLSSDPSRAEEEERPVFLEAEAGISLAALAEFALEQGLRGLEFAHGIPGSLGGACYMNAGAYGEAMQDVLAAVFCMDEEGRFFCLHGEEQNFAYRSSAFSQRGLTVLKAYLCLHRGKKEEIRARMKDLLARRRASQPLEYPSAGSVFKRPEGHYTGKLIMDSGLKGCSVGGAEVSEKHAGFIINKTGEATAEEVLALLRHVQECVYANYQVKLERELRLLGEFEGREAEF